MPFHNDDFCRGIAMVLQGESKKAGTYVTHGGSLGTLREKMVRNFIAHETPDRFRVESGLIRDSHQPYTSRQCDLLVHESWQKAPLYRFEDFVIVHTDAARAVIEVKSDLDTSGFDEFLNVHASAKFQECICRGASIPTFGYGLTGATLDSIANYLCDGIKKDRLKEMGLKDIAPHLNWPVAIAVQSRNIIGVRPVRSANGKHKDWPICFCLADLTKAVQDDAKPVDGIETGFFIYFYGLHIDKRFELLTTEAVYGWFNNLPLSDDGKIWITPDGQQHAGNVGFE